MYLVWCYKEPASQAAPPLRRNTDHGMHSGPRTGAPPAVVLASAPVRRRDFGLMALRRARLNCEVGASSRWWLVPPEGRQACGRCSAVSGVTLAFALTALHSCHGKVSDCSIGGRRRHNIASKTPYGAEPAPHSGNVATAGPWKSLYFCGAGGGTSRGCEGLRTAAGARAVRQRLVADGLLVGDLVVVGGQAADASLTERERGHHRPTRCTQINLVK